MNLAVDHSASGITSMPANPCSTCASDRRHTVQARNRASSAPTFRQNRYWSCSVNKFSLRPHLRHRLAIGSETASVPRFWLTKASMGSQRPVKRPREELFSVSKEKRQKSLAARVKNLGSLKGISCCCNVNRKVAEYHDKLQVFVDKDGKLAEDYFHFWDITAYHH